MKLSIVAVAAVIALSSPALAQGGSSDTFSSDGLNGAMLGKSMRGVNNGVPYPNTNAANGTVGVGRGGWRHGAATSRHYRHYRHHYHYKHHRHH